MRAASGAGASGAAPPMIGAQVRVVPGLDAARRQALLREGGERLDALRLGPRERRELRGKLGLGRGLCYRAMHGHAAASA